MEGGVVSFSGNRINGYRSELFASIAYGVSPIPSGTGHTYAVFHDSLCLVSRKVVVPDQHVSCPADENADRAIREAVEHDLSIGRTFEAKGGPRGGGDFVPLDRDVARGHRSDPFLATSDVVVGDGSVVRGTRADVHP